MLRRFTRRCSSGCRKMAWLRACECFDVDHAIMRKWRRRLLLLYTCSGRHYHSQCGWDTATGCIHDGSEPILATLNHVTSDLSGDGATALSSSTAISKFCPGSWESELRV